MFKVVACFVLTQSEIRKFGAEMLQGIGLMFPDTQQNEYSSTSPQIRTASHSVSYWDYIDLTCCPYPSFLWGLGLEYLSSCISGNINPIPCSISAPNVTLVLLSRCVEVQLRKDFDPSLADWIYSECVAWFVLQEFPVCIV